MAVPVVLEYQARSRAQRSLTVVVAVAVHMEALAAREAQGVAVQAGLLQATEQ